MKNIIKVLKNLQDRSISIGEWENQEIWTSDERYCVVFDATITSERIYHLAATYDQPEESEYKDEKHIRNIRVYDADGYRENERIINISDSEYDLIEKYIKDSIFIE